MNRLDTATRARVISCLVEGCSLRSTCRMTGVAMNTVLKLLTELGAACDAFQDGALRGLSTKRVQADEIWSFCYAKDKNIPKHRHGISAPAMPTAPIISCSIWRPALTAGSN